MIINKIKTIIKIVVTRNKNNSVPELYTNTNGKTYSSLYRKAYSNLEKMDQSIILDYVWENHYDWVMRNGEYKNDTYESGWDREDMD